MIARAGATRAACRRRAASRWSPVQMIRTATAPACPSSSRRSRRTASTSLPSAAWSCADGLRHLATAGEAGREALVPAGDGLRVREQLHGVPQLDRRPTGRRRAARDRAPRRPRGADRRRPSRGPSRRPAGPASRRVRPGSRGTRRRDAALLPRRGLAASVGAGRAGVPRSQRPSPNSTAAAR